MKVNFIRFLAVTAILALFTGCYHTPEGEAKLTPMPIGAGKDKIESRYERPVETIFAAAKEVLRFNGTLYDENTIAHTLAARVDTRTVYISVDEVEPKISRVVVQARTKARLPDIALASEIDKQIALKLAAGTK
jgi:hypothetical protein